MVGTQHLRGHVVGSVELRQIAAQGLVGIDVENDAVVAQKPETVFFVAPVSGFLVFLQLHHQLIRKYAAHHRMPHPGQRLEDFAGLFQFHGEEVAAQLRQHPCAQV